MGTVAPVQIPPLPKDTAGRWLEVVPEDDDMILRWLNVMRQMNRSYLYEDLAKFKRSRGHRPSSTGGSYYYWNLTSEVVLRIGLLSNLRRYQIISVGFVGDITPRAALALLVGQITVFLRGVGASTAVALPPKHMDSTRLLEMFALVPIHPKMRVTKERESELATRWNIQFTDLTSPE